MSWEYDCHVCIDDASRIAYAEIKKSERKASAIAFLKAAVIYYAKLGISIQRVMTDNGSCYKISRLRPSLQAARSQSTSEPGPTPRKPMARPSVSSKLHSANGPMPKPISTQMIVAQSFRSGCTASGFWLCCGRRRLGGYPRDGLLSLFHPGLRRPSAVSDRSRRLGASSPLRSLPSPHSSPF